jgi:predicted PurR-regulated permease PerM
MAFLVGFIGFFIAIMLTLILGAVSRAGDRRVALEGRVTSDQRPPLDRDERTPNPAHLAYHYT